VDEERIIELMITKDYSFDLEQEEDEINPTIRKFSRK
jgi:hypothetical protein